VNCLGSVTGIVNKAISLVNTLTEFFTLRRIEQLFRVVARVSGGRSSSTKFSEELLPLEAVVSCIRLITTSHIPSIQVRIWRKWPGYQAQSAWRRSQNYILVGGQLCLQLHFPITEVVTYEIFYCIYLRKVWPRTWHRLSALPKACINTNHFSLDL